MTEKRFTKVEHIFELNDEGIKDNQTRIEYYYALDLIDLLNESSEENEQLKQDKKELNNELKTLWKYLKPFSNLARDYNLTFKQLYELTKTAIEKGGKR